MSKRRLPGRALSLVSHVIDSAVITKCTTLSFSKKDSHDSHIANLDDLLNVLLQDSAEIVQQYQKSLIVHNKLTNMSIFCNTIK